MTVKQSLSTLLMLLTLIVGYFLGSLTRSSAQAQPASERYHITNNADGYTVYIWDLSSLQTSDKPKSITVWRADWSGGFTKSVIPFEEKK